MAEEPEWTFSVELKPLERFEWEPRPGRASRHGDENAGGIKARQTVFVDPLGSLFLRREESPRRASASPPRRPIAVPFREGRGHDLLVAADAENLMQHGRAVVSDRPPARAVQIACADGRRPQPSGELVRTARVADPAALRCWKSCSPRS